MSVSSRLDGLARVEEAALEDDFGGDDGEEDSANEGVQPEEGEVDPVQTAAAGDPMFEDEAAYDNQPPDEIRDAKPAQDSKRDQQTAHEHVGEESCSQGVLGAPGDYE